MKLTAFLRLFSASVVQVTSEPRAFPVATRPRPSLLRRLVLPGACLVLANCGGATKWSMMPTPTVHQYLGESVFDTLASEEKSPEIEIFYATNRPGTGPADERTYGNGTVDELQLGQAVVHLGDRRMRWRDLLKFSTRRERKAEIPLRLGNTTEIATLPGKRAADFSREINRSLADHKYKEIVLYVHGAKSSFFKACVQGAQFHHFMVREGVLVSYSWPSTGRFLSYDKDVELAAQSVGKFAELVEFLATRTDARKINILAYSAGAQVVAPGLAMLREKHAGESAASLRRRLRIGEVYFAAPDVSFSTFTNTYLPAFIEIVDNTTVTFHREDSVLGFARFANKESRLGRPEDAVFTEREIAFLEDAAKHQLLDAIDMQYSPEKRPFDFRAHGHWYSNEWVSSDVIIQFFVHERPDQRGLKKKPDSEAWYFPADYPDTLKRLVEESKRERE